MSDDSEPEPETEVEDDLMDVDEGEEMDWRAKGLLEDSKKEAEKRNQEKKAKRKKDDEERIRLKIEETTKVSELSRSRAFESSS